MNARSAIHAHAGTSMSTKFPTVVAEEAKQHESLSDHLVSVPEPPMTACAAARRAIGTRNGEQLT